jgi:cytochrome P450
LRCLFSVRLEGQYEIVFDALTTLLRDAERRVWSFASPPLCVPTPHNLECQAALKALDHFVYGIIAERRANLGEHDDLLEILVTEHAQRMHEGMPESLLRDQVLSIVLAGHETTANGMAWAWYLLSKHVDAARRVESEVDQVLEGRVPQFADLAQLTYTKMVFDETLRLYPPVWTMSRDAIKDDWVGGIMIPAGITVMLCPYVVHRRPELWSNPEGFDPERFAASSHAEIQRYAYFPFGGGPRGCLGGRFATIESMVILVMVTQTYQLELVPGQTVEPEPMITLRPKNGFFMHPRKA